LKPECKNRKIYPKSTEEKKILLEGTSKKLQSKAVEKVFMFFLLQTNDEDTERLISRRNI